MTRSFRNIEKAERRRITALRCLPCLAVLLAALPASAQTVDLFPANHQNAQREIWTRVAIPPDHPVSNVPQWHIDYAKRQIVCDGNGGHEWLRFNHELTNFTFHVKWRFTPVTTGTPKYNSGVFFRNNLDGTIWHQAQTSLAGGYIFGLTPINGKPTRFNLQKEMKENRVKPAGQWNSYDIRCVGDTCTLAVNGEVVNTTKVGLDKGYVGLESEGYQITFKDLKLRELP
jgi:3-keto-disaccharide hydrolase